MNFLVIGQGGREHAIVKALLLTQDAKSIHVIPGNSGIGLEVKCYPIDWKNFDQVFLFCKENKIEVVVIGPEDPLVAGLSDFLRDRNILVVGPSKDGAQLEGSKVFSKEFMLEFGVATAKAVEVKSVADVQKYWDQFTPPYVLKADGLAAGKGVVICKDRDQLKLMAEQYFEKKIFGLAGEKALLEQFLPGYELSLILMTNGKDYQLFPLAQDHKQVYDGDQGPNTGGMGTIAPIEMSYELKNEIISKVIEPTMKGLQNRKMFYRGVIFLGLMITEEGPQLIEYNCRLGDPETQVIMPLLDGDWSSVFFELAKGNMIPLKWKSLYTTCVVMAAPGYPENPLRGVDISGDILYSNSNSYFIHAGTQKDSEGHWKTNGGRVLGAVGLGTIKEESRTRAYDLTKKVNWNEMRMRSDIGLRNEQTNLKNQKNDSEMNHSTNRQANSFNK